AAVVARPTAGGVAEGTVFGIRLLHAGRAAETEPADRAMPVVHGVRRPLEIHPRLGFSADALRPAKRSAGICRPRGGSRLRRRNRAAAGGTVRLGAASEEPH